jgi:hypothetical protein
MVMDAVDGKNNCVHLSFLNGTALLSGRAGAAFLWRKRTICDTRIDGFRRIFSALSAGALTAQLSRDAGLE